MARIRGTLAHDDVRTIVAVGQRHGVVVASPRAAAMCSALRPTRSNTTGPLFGPVWSEETAAAHLPCEGYLSARGGRARFCLPAAHDHRLASARTG